jgi:hypothetical protein
MTCEEQPFVGGKGLEGSDRAVRDEGFVGFDVWVSGKNCRRKIFVDPE